MKTAWVIEDGASSENAPLFVSIKEGLSWSYLPADSLRFARAKDAQDYAKRHLPNTTNVRISLHHGD